MSQKGTPAIPYFGQWKRSVSIGKHYPGLGCGSRREKGTSQCDMQGTPMFRKQMKASEMEVSSAAAVNHFWAGRNQVAYSHNLVLWGILHEPGSSLVLKHGSTFL